MTGSSSGRADPLLASIPWKRLIDAQLEELMWGLLENMGGVEMTWRAGSVAGVNAADGGRDIEVTMRTPLAEGGFRDERWWVEAKGRSGTVSKRIVSDAVVNAVAYPEVDVVVIATNSVYTNAAHDWVREWNRSGNRVRAVLWDRANLGSMVRDAPLVAARALPEALEPADRLSLLQARFDEFGETPSPGDLHYFWEHQEAVASGESAVRNVSMLLYADEGNWDERPWTTLLKRDDESVFTVLMTCFFALPQAIFPDRVRALDFHRLVTVAAHLLIAFIDDVEPEIAADIAGNPFKYLRDSEESAATEDAGHSWRDQLSFRVLERVQDEMGSICGSDCARVSTERSAFPTTMDSRSYFRRFGEGDPTDTRILTIINLRVPCVVGLEPLEGGNCLVVQDLDDSYGATPRFFEDLKRIVKFRRENPGSQYLVGYNARTG